MVVFEAGAPKKSDYRRFKIRSTTEGVPDDFAAMEEVLTRRLARWESEQDLSPNDPKRNESFATLPSLIVIDGGPGQLSAGIRALQGFIDKGVTVISLAKRVEEVFVPGRHEPLVLAHDTPELQLLQRVRDEAHRFAITHHRQRRDRGMTESVLDGLPGVGPKRKRALLQALRLARPVLAASREALEAVPGLPSKTARDLYAYLNRTSAGDRATRQNQRRDHRDEPGLHLEPGGPRRHHGVLGRRQVDGDERLRGHRLLLRRQPAARDDPRARRPVRPRGLEGRARRDRLRRARRRAVRRAAPTCSTTCASTASSTTSCSSTPTRTRCSAATRRPAGAIRSARRARSRRGSRPSRRRSRRSRRAPTSCSTRAASARRPCAGASSTSSSRAGRARSSR